MADAPKRKPPSPKRVGRDEVKRPSEKMEAGWPVDQNGRPMAQISFAASELVPTAQYANVTLGPAQATIFVENDEQAIHDGLGALAEITETVIGNHRSLVLDSLKAER